MYVWLHMGTMKTWPHGHQLIGSCNPISCLFIHIVSLQQVLYWMLQNRRSSQQDFDLRFLFFATKSPENGPFCLFSPFFRAWLIFHSFWHNRAAFRRATSKDVRCQYKWHYFLFPSLSFSSLSTFFIEGVPGSKTYLAKIDGSAQ